MDIEVVLNKLESFGIVRLSRVAGDYYSIYCPIHKDGNERKPSCGVLLHDQYRNGRHYTQGTCHCFTCGYVNSLQGMVSDVLKRKGIDKSGMRWLKENIPEFEYEGYEYETDDLVPGSMIGAVISKYNVDYINTVLNKNKARYVSEKELSSYRFTVDYMYKRGLTDEIIERYDIGFDANHIPENKNKPVPCVTFPVRDIHGRCLFIFRRSIEGRYFNYPTGVEKPVYGLYELNPNDKTVVICESAFNMMTCVRHGFNTVALFGTGNQLQLQQLKEIGARRFILGLDPDEAGQRGMNKLRKHLRNVAFISQFEGIPSGKDLNDLTDEEFGNLTIV